MPIRYTMKQTAREMEERREGEWRGGGCSLYVPSQKITTTLLHIRCETSGWIIIQGKQLTSFQL